MKSIEQQETYNTARCRFLSALLFRYLHKSDGLNRNHFNMHIFGEIPIGAVVVPFALGNPEEWYVGWYRAKNADGYDLIESVETHEIRRFYNCGFLYVEDEDFTDNQWFRYSDRQYAIISTITERLSRVSHWYSIGAPTFHEDNSIDIPIRQSFSDDFCTKTYRSLRAITIKALKKHCDEVDKLKQEANQ